MVKKETLAKGKGNVYSNLLGNDLNNTSYLLNSNTMWLMHASAMSRLKFYCSFPAFAYTFW